jgi:phosphonate transport system permease protein
MREIPLPAGCRVCNLVMLAALLSGIGASFWLLELPLMNLLSAEAMVGAGRFLAEFFPPASSPDFLHKVTVAAWETLAISAVATLLAVIGGALLAMPASGRYGQGLALLVRGILIGLRSVPELVWATLTVLAAGLGPFAGTLALALHTTGVLGRLFGEALENTPAAPAAVLRGAGAPAAPAFLYGTLPLVLPQWVAYALYRWEMNIRMAAVLGFVGAGGLGQMLYYHLSLFQQAEACTVIIAMLLLTIAVDAASAKGRQQLITAGR